MDPWAEAFRAWLMDGSVWDLALVVGAAVVMYAVALGIVRLGKKRFLGRNTVFDGLLAFMLGSVLSRAINGESTLAATALAGFTLMGVHFLAGGLAMRHRGFGLFVKGKADRIVDRGVVDERALASHSLTLDDLEEAARASGLRGAADVEEAHFERSGQLSIRGRREARVVEVRVEEGVQTVRIEVR